MSKDERREIEELARAVVARLTDATIGGGQPAVGFTAKKTPADWWRAPSQSEPDCGEALSEGDVPPRFADLIDHTLLKAAATRYEVDRLCDEAVEHRFAAVCVNGAWVSRCATRLVESAVRIVAVAGFPLGAMPSAAKVAEARCLIDAGADEIDMVAPIGHILDGDWDFIEDDIAGVVQVAAGRTVKVILETAVLDRWQIVKAAALAGEAGAGFVKTSTGFHAAGGATVEAVALIRAAVGRNVGVKAAGGIRTCTTALRMIAAGATRLGTSSSVSLVGCVGRASPLAALIADPDRHATGCKLSGAESDGP